MNGAELSQIEKDAVWGVVDVRETVLSLTAEMSIEECSPELLSAIAKLKAGASANGLGLTPGGDLSRPGAKRQPGGRDRKAERARRPAEKRARGRDGRRADPQEIDRVAHEVIAAVTTAVEAGDTLTGAGLARAININDHKSALFIAAVELAIKGGHIAEVGKWRNGPVYGLPATTSKLGPESSPRTSELAQEPGEGPGVSETPEPEDEDDEELEGAEGALRDLDEDMPLGERIVLLVEARGPIRVGAIGVALDKAPSTIDLIIRNDLSDRLQNGPSGWELRE